MKNKKIKSTTMCFMIALIGLLAVRFIAMAQCTYDAPATCHSASTNDVAGCHIVTTTASYTLCSSTTNGLTDCSSPTNYNCIWTITSSGALCLKKGTGTQTNAVSQTTATGDSCPGG